MLKRNLPRLWRMSGPSRVLSSILEAGSPPSPTRCTAKPSRIRVRDGRLYDNLPGEFRAARYHSLFAVRDSLPACLCVTAESDDGVVMAVEHTDLPIAAVQFHPESILTLQEDLGLRLMHNVVETLTAPRKVQAA